MLRRKKTSRPPMTIADSSLARAIDDLTEASQKTAEAEVLISELRERTMHVDSIITTLVGRVG